MYVHFPCFVEVEKILEEHIEQEGAFSCDEYTSEVLVYKKINENRILYQIGDFSSTNSKSTFTRVNKDNGDTIYEWNAKVKYPRLKDDLETKQTSLSEFLKLVNKIKVRRLVFRNNAELYI